MDPTLIRYFSDSGPVSKKNQRVKTKEDKRLQLPVPLPLGLLQNDRSTLTTNEWTLLSNCLYAFDEQNCYTRIQNFLNELSSLPPKLRSKPSEIVNLMRELYSSVGPLIERSSDFHSLPVDGRQVLIKHNLYSLPLGLLQNDRSTLTTNEWTLLSNCLHAFDEQNPSARIQNSLNELTSLPPKLRLKPLELTNLIRELFSSIGPLIERSSDFHSLPVNVRQILVKRNLYITGSMNGLFLCRELHVLDNMSVLNSYTQLYGCEYMIECRRKIARYDPNGSLIKIFVFILAFSSNCSLVTYDSQADLTIMSNSIHLVPIQNVYITMLWKYLIYLYGFKEAVLRFTRLIKDVLDLVNMLSQAPQTETRSRIMNPIVTETEHTLMNGN
ncbi:unnamed protein product [Rotaria sp. Silwood1]|nr:unnamed protein product [Rotaria sp. Silwood1]CAF3388392.1 unnamed protein product [Rotaria sp. Silwood1]